MPTSSPRTALLGGGQLSPGGWRGQPGACPALARGREPCWVSGRDAEAEFGPQPENPELREAGS